jgi:transposase
MNNNKSEQKVSRKKYSSQFKDQALERAVKDGVPQVAKDLGIKESMLYYWRSQQKQGGDSIENQKLQQAEVSRLKREVARLAEENAFLKKAAACVPQAHTLHSFLINIRHKRDSILERISATKRSRTVIPGNNILLVDSQPTA